MTPAKPFSSAPTVRAGQPGMRPCVTAKNLFRWLAALLLGVWLAHAAAQPPALMLANVYRPNLPLAPYWVSEKLDGVRGYWDGKALWTRGGEAVAAPSWFTAGWPARPLDGELWAGRGQFSHAVSTVRQRQPIDAAWRRMRFMVFDLPAEPGDFDQRLAVLRRLLAQPPSPWLAAVEQFRVRDHAALQARLHAVVRAGGEGLMLHRGDAPYRALRSDDLLKVKTHDDAEARVVAHLPGSGKYRGMLGALLVESADGRRFKLGSGFSAEQRQAPPAIGSWVTYRFRGLNPGGLPRFASFVRVRADWPPAAADGAPPAEAAKLR